MVHSALPGARLRAARRIQGGLSNLNYRIDLEGRQEPVLLRVYLRDAKAGPLEAALGRRLQGLLPVPVFLAQAPSNPATGHAYAVTSWLEGETVDLGHILRPPAGAVPGFQQGLISGYTGSGGKLPPDWRALSRLMELVAFVEFLSRPKAGPEVIRSARLAVRDTIQTWQG